MAFLLATCACQGKRSRPGAEPSPALPDAGHPVADPLDFPASRFPPPPTPEPEVREAVRALIWAAVADPQADHDLVSGLLAHPKGRTGALLDLLDEPTTPAAERHMVLQALRRLPDGAAAPRLARECVLGKDPILAGEAADALAASAVPLGAGALEAMSLRPEVKNRRRAALALASLGAGGVEAREAALRSLRRLSSAKEAPIREAALRGLVTLGGPADAHWLSLRTKDEDSMVRRRAVEGLAQHGTRDHLPLLLEALKDKFGPVAAVAAKGLERLRSPAAVPGLLTYLSGEERTALDPVMRTLGAIGDARAVRYIVPYLFDRDAYVRVSAARALAAIGEPEAIPQLIRALDGEFLNARIAAAEALGAFGPARGSDGVAALRKVAKDDPEPAARAAAEAALVAVPPASGP